MSFSRPRSLQQLCRQAVPPILREADGKGMVDAIAEIVATDRWNSFDRFHETTKTLVRRYEEAGAVVEVDAIQTGGRMGSGRWIIREAADVHAATVDVVAPVKQRLLDYRDNPWHAVQWTSATPAAGLRTQLVVLDSVEEIQRLPADGLAGKTLLTSLNIRSHMKLIADKGAACVITDIPVSGLPDATPWTKFGWGGVPMGHSEARLVGLVLSAREGGKLRRLARRHEVELLTKVDARKYVGTQDVVSGIVRGAELPEEEIWVMAHSGEPGALDNASGVALTLEVARLLEALIASGAIPRPRRTIRLLNGYECYGFFGYLEKVERPHQPLAGINVDSVGAKPAVCQGRVEWHSTIPMSARFVDWVGEAVLRAVMRRFNPGYKLYLEPFRSTADTLIGDPQYGFPCPWLSTHQKGYAFDAYHSSGDTLKLVSPGGMKLCAASVAAYAHYLADADDRSVAEMARSETQRILGLLEVGPRRLPSTQVHYLQEAHATSMDQLRRFSSDGSGLFEECAREVRTAGIAVKEKASRRRVPADARKIPLRTAPLSPNGDNTPPEISARISRTRISSWTLFWADGRRTLADIAELASWDECDGRYSSGSKGYHPVDVSRVIEFFEAHAELGYVSFCPALSLAG